MAHRVLFITRKWPPAVGGMETYCVELVAALRARSDIEAVDVIALPGRTDGRTPHPVAIIGFGLMTVLRLVFGGRRADVVHGADMAIWPLVLLARWRTGAEVALLSAHGTDVAFAGRDGWAARFYRRYLEVGARVMRAGRVIANSRATADLVRSLGFRTTGVALLGARPAGDQDALAPSDDGAPYILFAGRLIRRKGCRWFIAHVLPGLPDDMRLKVAGPPGEDDEMAALDHPRVDYLGPVRGAALARLRAGALVVIAPNLAGQPEDFEGFGLTTIEAAAEGAVVLAARAYGIADAVLDGETGLLLPPGSAIDWRQAILNVDGWTSEARARFIERARAAAAREFTWERVADRTVAHYQNEPASAVLGAARVA